MARSAPNGGTPNAAEAAAEARLAEVGLVTGATVRFVRRGAVTPEPAVVVRLEADDAVTIRDADGALRTLRPEAVQVEVVGPRGGRTWADLAARLNVGRQLSLGFDAPTGTSSGRSGRSARR